jgi:catechol 2,3-dioxygenase-like lactoylglutathione lyase family enzyme
MANNIRLGDIVVDCKDADQLCSFYTGLLGWKRGEFFGNPTAVSEDGSIVFVFVPEEDYVPPVWPEEDGKQQKQVHFDFLVPDVAEAVARAEALGAVKAQAQFGGDAFTTMIDPAGHPLCLCKG